MVAGHDGGAAGGHVIQEVVAFIKLNIELLPSDDLNTRIVQSCSGYSNIPQAKGQRMTQVVVR